MNVRLILMRNRKRVWTTQLRDAEEATLGRARGCTVRVPSSQVSRLHCRLHIRRGLVTVEDLESVNGTFINGKRVRDSEIVHPGDRLSIGPATFVVEYELSTTTLKALGGDEDHLIQETAGDVDLVEEAGSESEMEAPQVTEAEVEIVEDNNSKRKKKRPAAEEPVEVVEETDVETVPLMEEDEIHMSDGDSLRDFLIELDNADNPSNE